MGQLQSNQESLGADDAPNNPETAWWCKLLARIVGTLAGGLAVILGIWRAVSLSALCIASGILLLFVGLVVLIFEAPICCSFFNITKPIQTFAEKRPYLHKAIIYVVLAIPPFAMCVSLTTLFGAGTVFAAGVIYGLMALGKKADREEMRGNANVTQQLPSAAPVDDTRVNLIASEVTDNSNPFTATGPMQMPPIPMKK